MLIFNQSFKPGLHNVVMCILSEWSRFRRVIHMFLYNDEKEHVVWLICLFISTGPSESAKDVWVFPEQQIYTLATHSFHKNTTIIHMYVCVLNTFSKLSHILKALMWWKLWLPGNFFTFWCIFEFSSSNCIFFFQRLWLQRERIR